MLPWDSWGWLSGRAHEQHAQGVGSIPGRGRQSHSFKLGEPAQPLRGVSCSSRGCELAEAGFPVIVKCHT